MKSQSVFLVVLFRIKQDTSKIILYVKLLYLFIWQERMSYTLSYMRLSRWMMTMMKKRKWGQQWWWWYWGWRFKKSHPLTTTSCQISDPFPWNPGEPSSPKETSLSASEPFLAFCCFFCPTLCLSFLAFLSAEGNNISYLTFNPQERRRW